MSEHFMTPQQHRTLEHLCCRITQITIHPYSGAATVKHGDTDMAIIEADGTVSWGYKFPDGQHVHRSLDVHTFPDGTTTKL